MSGKIARSTAPAQLNFAFIPIRCSRCSAGLPARETFRSTGRRSFDVRCSMFDVERWAFPSIQRTSHTQPRLIQDVGIDHGGRYVLVPEKFLNGANIIAVLKQMRREGMTKRMTSCRLSD